MHRGTGRCLLCSAPRVPFSTPYVLGVIAEWLASPGREQEVVGSNPGVAESDGQ